MGSAAVDAFQGKIKIIKYSKSRANNALCKANSKLYNFEIVCIAMFRWNKN
jgi:hypothetical protein